MAREISIEIEPTASALAFLQLCYRATGLPIELRIQAAIACLGLEKPRVGQPVAAGDRLETTAQRH